MDYSGGYRVAEVRLLHDVVQVGSVHPKRQRSKDNLLIRGDALHALTSLTSLPEYAAEYVGKVKLVYIDPPFNTGQAFTMYDEALEHSVWLTMMRDRLTQIRDLLAPDDSVWVHLDDAEMAYCRVLMDEIFGRSGFVSTIVWQKRYSRSNDAIFSSSHDYLLVYARQPVVWGKVRNRVGRDVDQKQYRNPDGDPLGPWRAIPFDAPERPRPLVPDHHACRDGQAPTEGPLLVDHRGEVAGDRRVGPRLLR